MDDKSIKKGNGIITAGLVLGIVAIATCFVPIVNNGSVVMGLLAAVFAIVGLVKKTKARTKAVTALILGALSVVIALSLQASWSKSIDKVVEDVNTSIDTASGDRTEELLKTDVQVGLGEFMVEKGEYTTDTSMAVEVKNKNSERKSYSISIEAIDAGGNRIDEDTVYANDLGSGQSQSFKAFEFVTSDKVDELSKATFKIYKVSQY